MATPVGIDIDAKTVVAVITAVVSLWLLFRRWLDEAHKTRLVELEKKALDQLFRFRTTLVACLDRLEDAPDVEDDTTANLFYGAVRSVRRDVRHTINEFLLFTTREEYETLSDLYREADRHFQSLAQQLAIRHVDYSAANLFKRAIYQLLEDIEVRILKTQELDGRARTNEISAVRLRYAQRKVEIDRLVSSATGFVPVPAKSPAVGAVLPAQEADAPAAMRY